MHDALADVVHAEECDAEVTAIFFQRLDLFRTEGIGDAQGPVGGRNVVIRHRQCGARTSRPAACELESFKRLRRCHFVDQLTIDIEQGGPVRLCALVVIAIVYTAHVSLVALAVAVGLFGVLVGLRRVGAVRKPLTVAVAVALWVAMFKSGIDPVISGLAVGLATGAYAPSREDLDRGIALAYSFREQPTPELARSAREGLLSAISPNERLQYSLHPWASYVIVPLFALANAGVHVTGTLLAGAIASPVTLGILIGYVVGKPVGISVGSWLATRPALHGPRPPLTPPMVVAGGACAGIGFTVSLLISSLAFHGRLLSEAKLGALGSVILAPLVTWSVLRIIRRMPTALRARQLGRTAEDILDLAEDVDPSRDHIRGSNDAPVTLVEYGDFECTYCGQAEQVIRELLADHASDVRYVWRHVPLNDVHPNAQLAAEASEAAAAQGNFWEMYDILIGHQGALRLADVAGYARALGLDSERLADEVRRGEYRERVTEDVASADESGVSGTPTFFINGLRHYGVYDTAALTDAVQAANAGRTRSPSPSATAGGRASACIAQRHARFRPRANAGSPKFDSVTAGEGEPRGDRAG